MEFNFKKLWPNKEQRETILESLKLAAAKLQEASVKLYGATVEMTKALKKTDLYHRLENMFIKGKDEMHDVKTPIETIAKFFGIIAWADGKLTDDEKKVIGDIAKSYKLTNEDGQKLQEAVESSYADIKDLDEEKLNSYLKEVAGKVEKGDANYLFQGALELTHINGVLRTAEVENLLALASCLGVTRTHATLMIASLVKEDPAMIVKA